jgi:hypothetical protein
MDSRHQQSPWCSMIINQKGVFPLEATKSDPAPLDAFETAKPDEPIYTLQGGDPLSSPLLRIWAHFARIQAGIIPPRGIEGIFEEILRAANNNEPESEAGKDDLLVRATQTEQISWLMDNYRKGYSIEEREEIAKTTVFNKLDVYDIRRKCCSLMSTFFSEFNDFRLELIDREYLREGDYIDHQILRAIADLRYIMSTMEIRRGE